MQKDFLFCHFPKMKFTLIILNPHYLINLHAFVIILAFTVKTSNRQLLHALIPYPYNLRHYCSSFTGVPCAP